MTKIDAIKKGVDELRERLIIGEPAHFSMRDLVDAFFGALFLGMPFSIKGLLLDVVKALDTNRAIVIIISTLLILSAEIYFIGYSRVTKKAERKFGQFWLKRMIAFYSVAVIVASFLVFIFGLNTINGMVNDSYNIFKLIVVISMPCAIGAAVTDLIKKY